jgi:hypothetical protein
MTALCQEKKGIFSIFLDSLREKRIAGQNILESVNGKCKFISVQPICNEH